MFGTTAEAKDGVLDPVKHVKTTPHPSNLYVSLTVPKRASVVVPRCYTWLHSCVYGLQQYGHLNNSCPLCFQFSSFCYVI